MTRKFLSALGLFAAVTLTGCATEKSSNPLSPSVAGPIPGVAITAPTPVQPSNGTQVAVDQQPLTLMVSNASTSGVRPLSYVFEVATDVNFANKVFLRDSIVPGDGKTVLKLPDPLTAGRGYYWHARAEDGANTGPFSLPVSFNVFVPVVIQAPGLVAPINNATTDSIRPRFTMNNAARTGPAGAISYVIEVADSDTFGNKLGVWTSAEQANQTTIASTVDLPYSKQLFWHARAYDPGTLGPWSAPQAFQTPAAPVVVVPTPTPTPTPGGPAPNDAIDLGQARVYNSPPDVASWPATAKITRIDMGSSGLSIQFSTQGTWPDVVPPGFGGPLQYTVWAVVKINGQWYTSGFIQMWRGRPGTGAPILSDFGRNWAYDSRWGPMAGYQPQPGEQMGFFVTAGNARGESGVSSVRERSNVVLISLPAGDSGSFPF
jgi:hypothetical protein